MQALEYDCFDDQLPSTITVEGLTHLCRTTSMRIIVASGLERLCVNKEIWPQWATELPKLWIVRWYSLTQVKVLELFGASVTNQSRSMDHTDESWWDRFVRTTSDI